MIIPDFTGMAPEKANKHLSDDYPHISCQFIMYTRPDTKKAGETAGMRYRIIRQKFVEENQLEFIISSFYDPIE